jgi:TPR repeat protein
MFRTIESRVRQRAIGNLITAGLVALVLSLGPAAPVAAGPLEDGVVAYGRGDYATALRLIRPLADQGNPSAQAMLGLMYALGRGVKQDSAAALTWYRKAADQGFASAQSDLGSMYDQGFGVKQDYAAALTWYRKAADQGFAGAEYNLGSMYGSGKGVPQDYVMAHMWLNLAVAGGSQEALQDREVVERRMTPAQIAEAQRLAREWKPKSN